MATSVWIGAMGGGTTPGSDGTFVAPSVTLVNNGAPDSGAVWFGSSDGVSVGNGFPVLPGQCITLDISADAPVELWVVGENDTAACHVWGFQES